MKAPGPGPGGDGLLLAELAGLDERLRERGAAWEELVRRLDGLRREVAVAGAQLQRSRSRALGQAPPADDGAGEPRLPAPDRDVERPTRLTREFEAALRETEERRLALHAEMEDLRHRRRSLVERLPAALARAWRSLVAASRVPAVAAVANGTCGGCRSPLPEATIDALGDGGVAECPGCERLLVAVTNARS